MKLDRSSESTKLSQASSNWYWTATHSSFPLNFIEKIDYRLKTCSAVGWTPRRNTWTWSYGFPSNSYHQEFVHLEVRLLGRYKIYSDGLGSRIQFHYRSVYIYIHTGLWYALVVVLRLLKIVPTRETFNGCYKAPTPISLLSFTQNKFINS